MIPERLALLLIKQKNHNKRFGGFEFKYFGGSDVANKLSVDNVVKNRHLTQIMKSDESYTTLNSAKRYVNIFLQPILHTSWHIINLSILNIEHKF